METDPSALAELAAELASSAGEIVRKGLGAGAVHTKSSSVDVVTEVDRASEDFLVQTLGDRRPDDGILGEEGAAVDGSSGIRWVIDPLDGTVNFIYGIPVFAVSVGVEKDGVAVAGAVYNPTTDELYVGAKGSGSTCNGTPLKVRSAPLLSKALVATGFSYQSENRAQQAEVLRKVLPLVRDIRRAGSASLDLCSLAAGRLDGYYEVGVHPWDVTAGEVIATEAGARVTSFKGGRAMNDVVAAHPGLQSELRRLVT